MKAGQLKYPIEIQHLVNRVNEYGEKTQEYVKVRNTRANVKYKTGDRNDINDELQLNYKVQFIVRRYVEIDDTTIIIFQNHKYRVEAYHTDYDYNNIVVETSIINE